MEDHTLEWKTTLVWKIYPLYRTLEEDHSRERVNDLYFRVEDLLEWKIYSRVEDYTLEWKTTLEWKIYPL